MLNLIGRKELLFKEDVENKKQELKQLFTQSQPQPQS